MRVPLQLFLFHMQATPLHFCRPHRENLAIGILLRMSMMTGLDHCLIFLIGQKADESGLQLNVAFLSLPARRNTLDSLVQCQRSGACIVVVRLQAGEEI